MASIYLITLNIFSMHVVWNTSHTMDNDSLEMVQKGKFLFLENTPVNALAIVLAIGKGVALIRK